MGLVVNRQGTKDGEEISSRSSTHTASTFLSITITYNGYPIKTKNYGALVCAQCGAHGNQ
jgi:hypothetical protein